MTDSTKNPVTAKFELGAKAAAKIEVKGEIPSSSLGRMFDALTDILRPFSERRGLRADQIRLQREEVAIKIAKLARQKIAIEKKEITDIEYKILVPLLEKSSQEDPNDEIMIERWADLLVSAAVADTSHPRLIQILSEITSKQALLLEKIMLNDYKDWIFPFKVFEDANVELDPIQIRRLGIDTIQQSQFSGLDALAKAIELHFNRPGAIFYNALFFKKGQGFIGDNCVDAPLEIAFDLQLCTSLGLLREHQIQIETSLEDGNVECEVTYYTVTDVGRTFLHACSRESIKRLELEQNDRKRTEKYSREILGTTQRHPT